MSETLKMAGRVTPSAFAAGRRLPGGFVSLRMRKTIV
jgi:hypothetical protein